MHQIYVRILIDLYSVSQYSLYMASHDSHYSVITRAFSPGGGVNTIYFLHDIYVKQIWLWFLSMHLRISIIGLFTHAFLK